MCKFKLKRKVMKLALLLFIDNSFRESVENRMNYSMLNMTTPISNTAQLKLTYTHCHTSDICTIKSLSSILNIIQARRVFISSKTSLCYKFIHFCVTNEMGIKIEILASHCVILTTLCSFYVCLMNEC